jgi:hypothetical protein
MEASKMQVTHYFADGSQRKTTVGLQVPYNEITAIAYSLIKRIAEQASVKDPNEK